jgi:phosphoglucosamine mutase
MTPEMALAIGRATARLLKRKGSASRIVIGKDTRISGYMLESALVSGICSVGVNAMLAGTLPTPGIAFITMSIGADAGIAISASHNPFQDNGIKIFSREGVKLPDEKELEIEDLVLSENMDILHPSPNELGRAYRIDDARDRYLVFLRGIFPKDYSLEGTKVVLDCAHGATYKVAPETFFELGAEVTTLFDEPNGENINDNCGSQHPETLAEEVVKRKADVGFAFDGDGDRCVAVDEKGSALTGDQIIGICAREMKKESGLANNLVVSTVMSNMGLGLALARLGIEQLITKVGDRYVLEAMQTKGALIGGEDSGHVIFLEHHTTGDGIITALQVLAAMKKTRTPLSELARVMTVYPQKLINVDVKSKPELSTIPEITLAIRNAEAQLGCKGRVLVRYSGTQDMCRVMVEGPTDEDAEKYSMRIAEAIREHLS